MSDVVEWLEARLAEVEAAARAAFGASWSLDEIADVWREDFDGQPHLVARRLTEADAAHVALNDPAAVLRSVAGARAVMGLHSAVDVTRIAPEVICRCCVEDFPCATLRALATGWGWDGDDAAQTHAEVPLSAEQGQEVPDSHPGTGEAYSGVTRTMADGDDDGGAE